MKIVSVFYPDQQKEGDEPQGRILIENMDDLNEYFAKVQKLKITGAFESVLGSADPTYNPDFTKGLTMSDHLKFEYNRNDMGLIEASMSLEEKMSTTKIKYVLGGNVLLINQKGGFHFLDSRSVIKKTEVVEFAPLEFIKQGVV